jgi:hypothetical protein
LSHESSDSSWNELDSFLDSQNEGDGWILKFPFVTNRGRNPVLQIKEEGCGDGQKCCSKISRQNSLLHDTTMSVEQVSVYPSFLLQFSPI